MVANSIRKEAKHKLKNWWEKRNVIFEMIKLIRKNREIQKKEEHERKSQEVKF